MADPAHAGLTDRRDDLRRRIYVALIAVGSPVMAANWWSRRDFDVAAIAYPAFIVVQLIVLILLLGRRIKVLTAERVVLVSTVATFLTELSVNVLTAPTLELARARVSISSLLTLALMTTLAYVAFETGMALRLSLSIVGIYLAVISVRAVPLLLDGAVSGAVSDFLAVGVFLATSVGLLHVLAQTKAQAAAARSVADAMETLANTDPLTGVANRRHLLIDLEERLTDRPHLTAVIMMDLDHFKTINDTRGHEVGDEVLRRTARTLVEVLGPDDVVGRWGGEEFLVLATVTEPEHALDVAERCRLAVRSTPLPDESLDVTASVGYAMPQEGETAAALLRRVDQALYAAKAAGRDRVVADLEHHQLPAAR